MAYSTTAIANFMTNCTNRNFKVITNRQAIAKAINLEDRAVFSIDLDNELDGYEDCYRSQKCRVAWEYEGKKHYNGSQLSYWGDEKKFSFRNGASILSSSEYMDEWLEDIDTARAPIVEDGTRFAIFCFSKNTGIRFVLTGTCTILNKNHYDAHPRLVFDINKN